MSGHEGGTRRFGNVTFVQGKHGGKYPYCNTIVVHGEVCAVVDPGCSRGDLAAALDGRAVDVLINSHFHEDHTTLNCLHPDAELWSHRIDAPPLGDINEYFNYAFPVTAELREFWESYIRKRHNYRERAPQRLLEDGEILDFGGATARVLHTPGHTPGHICLHFIEADLLYLADIDLTPFGPWYGDRKSSLDHCMDSIRRMKDVGARHTVVGHEGGPYEGDISALCDKYLAAVERREEGIFNALKTPMTLEELCNKWIIYKKPRQPVEYFIISERALVVKHLDRLERAGRVRRDGELFAAVP